MFLTGKLYKGTSLIKELKINNDNSDKPFRDVLEDSLIGLCRQLDIPVPIWLDKNTSELARHRKTVFLRDQFVEKVEYDKFEIKIEF
ncbi:UNVERIFIED_CONTAM: hypothetical protein Cloal_1370 [Acetivibrio alkalicellulosi]